ncbi:MAG TPA: hypothetical protein VJM09_09455 [Sphingobium sp.]|nr:hypothetical protein [Sphingobium sp.]
MRERWQTPRPARSETLNPSRAALKMMEQENKLYPATAFVDVPRVEWPANPPSGLIRALRSRDFMVQVYEEEGGILRLSVHRCAYDGATGRWKDGISWDDLQHIKTLVGYGNMPAVEIYPPIADEVNVANIRHLFILPKAPAFMWTKRRDHDRPA